MSLVTDAASEAIYPLLPYFLTTVLGAGALSLGVIEGSADAVNSVLKVLAGRWSDRSRRRRPLVLFGYALSSTVRPLMSLAGAWTQVLGIRFLDRVGKGLRGAPRDALLAAMATPDTRGRVFGFHRGMDHVGAIVGPILASAFLLWRPGQYRTLFALTLLPGAVAVFLILFVREPSARQAPDEGRHVRATATGDGSGPVLRRFFLILGLFTVGNSTDAYLLLRLTDLWGGVAAVPLAWAALHVVKAGVSFVAGGWSDRIGRRRVIGLGWIVYVLVYVGFAVSTSAMTLLACFLLYGCYFGLAEGAEKALIADYAPGSGYGQAFGIYTAVQGFGALAASLLFGVVWTRFGAPAAFATGAGLALVATLALFALIPDVSRPRAS